MSFTFRISGTDTKYTYKKKFTQVYPSRLEESIQYISIPLNEIVLYPGFKPRYRKGWVDIVKVKKCE